MEYLTLITLVAIWLEIDPVYPNIVLFSRIYSEHTHPRERKGQGQGQNMGKGNHTKYDETQGFLYLEHSNWAIRSLLS